MQVFVLAALALGAISASGLVDSFANFADKFDLEGFKFGMEKSEGGSYTKNERRDNPCMAEPCQNNGSQEGEYGSGKADATAFCEANVPEGGLSEHAGLAVLDTQDSVGLTTNLIVAGGFTSLGNSDGDFYFVNGKRTVPCSTNPPNGLLGRSASNWEFEDDEGTGPTPFEVATANFNWKTVGFTEPNCFFGGTENDLGLILFGNDFGFNDMRDTENPAAAICQYAISVV
uniref:Uncharacterized protein n=1 Tax=Chromera velia CCMP2878 TaxID=1169474 RepID=A0A0G4H6W0_9ALVE|eukprot:Cvel_24943.t1-p1 / transcript=Cvel_24943.t1 / gene=Cvel_24943 / organism=Chromera_velia_CCMP2878 / gene_product=hypothetical protein / transcript_product=hypothetical protein / location=Cvel_scaffold2760:8496-9783(+) / protein_length=229 / sequence_SO=supercontig / SO=protein_coding / is_pseudo=false